MHMHLLSEEYNQCNIPRCGLMMQRLCLQAKWQPSTNNKRGLMNTTRHKVLAQETSEALQGKSGAAASELLGKRCQ